MSDELLEELLAAPGLSFPDDTRRACVLLEARKLGAEEARAFYLAALEHPDLRGCVKVEIAAELEWWRFGDLAPSLVALAREVPELELQSEALTAIAKADRCVCEVYVQRSAKKQSPLMEKLRDLDTDHPQVEEQEYRCTACGATLVHRQEHHERGATVDRWRRVEPA